MSSVQTKIKYDGPALDKQTMDVNHLAPSLLALSDLIKATNQMVNGERAGVRVLVNVNLEQNCFELNLELAMTIWDQAKTLLSDTDVRSAKEIAEWIGIFTGASLGTYSLFKLVKWLRGRKVTSTKMIQRNGKSLVEITVEGEDKPVVVQQTVYNLYTSTKNRQAITKVLSPLREEGYESLQFGKDKHVYQEFTKEDVLLEDGSDLPALRVENEHTSQIRAKIKIRKAAYEGTSSWTFMYKRAVDVAFTDEAWLEQFQSGRISAPPGSYLDVDLEETYITNDRDEMIGKATYKIIKVHAVVYPEQQDNLNFKSAEDNLD